MVYGLEETFDFKGEYLGLDILQRHILWCKNNIQKIKPNYRFAHLDIQNDRYNSNGTNSADDIIFDSDSNSVDYVSSFSVFTHLYESNIRHYLQEIHRILIPSGRCLCTFFLFEDDRLVIINNSKRKLSMQYKINEYTRYHNPTDKLHAISYKKEFIEELVSVLGFKLIALNYGKWAGGEEIYQDYLVLEKITRTT